jgi:hypothetical protein
LVPPAVASGFDLSVLPAYFRSSAGRGLGLRVRAEGPDYSRDIGPRRSSARHISLKVKLAVDPAATMMLYFHVEGDVASGILVLERIVHFVPTTSAMPQCPMISWAMFALA